MTGISPLTAAELSDAAYPDVQAPEGWTDILPGVSPDGGSDSLSVFVNESTHQIVIAFKGTDNLSDFKSDLGDSGGSAWEIMRATFATTLAAIQNSKTYAGFEIMTDGGCVAIRRARRASSDMKRTA